jgi:hypothetical protein
MVVAWAVAGCQVGQSPAPSGQTPTPSGPVSPVDGIVTSIEAAGLTKVTGFTLRTRAGQTLTFSIGQLENGAQFPPGHLAEHQATAAPVRVWFTTENGRLVAYRLEDAPAT